MIEASGAAAFAVAGAGAHDQRQVARCPGFDETLLERGVQTFRNAALDKAGRRDDIAFIDERNCFVG